MNPFDLKTTLFAKHAQHVVLIHFPIALFIAAVAFDFLAQWTKRRGLADTAYYNLIFAAVSTFPVLTTGILAWRFQLEGQKIKGAPAAASRACMHFDPSDLVRVVGTFPYATARKGFAELSPAA